MAGWRVGFTLGRARRRRRAREAEVVPRLRHLPADPDRLDRRAPRGRRLPARGLRDLPPPPRRADLRPRARGLGRSSRRRGRCSSGRRSRSASATLGSLEFALRLAREARRRGEPGHRLRPGRRRARPLRARRERAADRPGDALDPQAAPELAASRRRPLPREAEPTVAAYLAKTPRVVARLRAASSRRGGAASSSAGMLEVERAGVSTSSTIVSPSRTAAIGPPRARLGRDVADHQAVRRAGEAAVGDQRDLVAEALADERGGDVQHLAHARGRRPGPRSGSRPRRPARSSAP